MTRHDNNYGAGGCNRDEFGPLPEKRIENMTGVDIAPKRPQIPGNISGWVFDFFDKKSRMPTKIIYPGPKCCTTSIGHIIPGLGFVSLDLVNVPNAPKARLE